MSDVLLEARGVTIAYGQRPVLREVDVTLAPGEVLLVVGPNGAGKSSLLGVLAGLSEPWQGQVERFVEGGAMAFLGHGTAIYGALSAFENVRFWTKLYGRSDADAAVEAVLERVGLASVAMEPAATFSRGMAQRLALARVLALAPRLVFLDEPSTGLDMASVAILHWEIAAMAAKGTGVVWVSHDVARDLPLATAVLHVRAGRVQFHGPAADFVPEAVC